MHIVKVYTLKGHMALIAGSKKEAIFIADLLWSTNAVYKVQVHEGINLPKSLTNIDGKRIYELI